MTAHAERGADGWRWAVAQERGAGLGDPPGVDLYVPPVFRVSGKEAGALAAEAAALESGREVPTFQVRMCRVFCRGFQPFHTDGLDRGVDYPPVHMRCWTMPPFVGGGSQDPSCTQK